jgi:hypothetical protein
MIEKPLPQSNTEIAKELRVVKVLAIIADTIHAHLLQPTYQDSDGNWPLRAILYDLAQTDATRERVLRGMLLAVLEKGREDAKAKLSDRIADEVMIQQGVKDLFLQDYPEFVNSLMPLLSSIQELWGPVQYDPQVFQSSFDDFQGTEFQWTVLNDTNNDSLQSPVQEDDEDIILLFPKISLVSDGDRCIAPGTIVRKSQIDKLFKEDRRNNRSADAGSSRSRQRPGRTLSVTSSARNGPTKEPFLSPTVGSSKQSGA